jgi:hypothetical protein
MSDEILLAVNYIYRFARPWGLCAAVYITASEHLVARACCADIYYVRPQHVKRFKNLGGPKIVCPNIISGLTRVRIKQF